MPNSSLRYAIKFVALSFATASAYATPPATYAELSARIQAADRASELVSVTSIGKSSEGRELWMVRLDPKDSAQRSTPPAFLYGRQHGNEPAGQEALLDLIEIVSKGEEAVPFPVLAIPCINPDGAERNERRNANRMDLNRDHLILSQPEIQALHAAFRQAKPRLAVDCHEFGRDSSDYTERGWSEWPQIMVDCANYPHPTLEPIYNRSVALIGRIAATMTAEGINTRRYIVGDAPPGGEVRFSTLESDDGRNAFGLYGIPSYIIESGVYRNAEDPDADMAKRVVAYRRLLKMLLEEAVGFPLTPGTEAIPKAARLLPTNNFWGMTRLDLDRTLPVIDQATSKTIFVPAPNFMDQRILKSVVPMPDAYAIVPGNSELYRDLLTSHGLSFEVLSEPVTRKTIRHRLEQIERETDTKYQRFGGRQVTSPLPPSEEQLPKGTIVIRADGVGGLRAAVILDPRMYYGLYQHRDFQKGLEELGVVPVRLLPAP